MLHLAYAMAMEAGMKGNMAERREGKRQPFPNLSTPKLLCPTLDFYTWRQTLQDLLWVSRTPMWPLKAILEILAEPPWLFSPVLPFFQEPASQWMMDGKEITQCLDQWEVASRRTIDVFFHILQRAKIWNAQDNIWTICYQFRFETHMHSVLWPKAPCLSNIPQLPLWYSQSILSMSKEY